MREGSPPPLHGRPGTRTGKRTRIDGKRKTRNRIPAGHPALDDGRDPRPQHVLSAYACDPSKAMIFTGETVGSFGHKMGPTTWARINHGQHRVSTLSDHVSSNPTSRISRSGPVTTITPHTTKDGHPELPCPLHKRGRK